VTSVSASTCAASVTRTMSHGPRWATRTSLPTTP
jgi:hypothetical protein